MIGKLVILLLLFFLMVGASWNDEGYSREEMNNFTANLDYDKLNLSINAASNNETEGVITRGIYKYADFLVFVTLEGGAELIEYGYEHPQYNYSLFIKLLILGILIPLFVPVFFAAVFIIYVSVWIFRKLGSIFLKWYLKQNW